MVARDYICPRAVRGQQVCLARLCTIIGSAAAASAPSLEVDFPPVQPPHPDRPKRQSEQGKGAAAADIHGKVIGPIFFETPQRKGDEDCGERNFRAPSESIEPDRTRRALMPGKPTQGSEPRS